MSQGPLISILIATRNAAGVLPHCLDSIAKQAFRAREVIVMDGASTDGTVDVLRTRTDVVTVWRSEPDSGIYNAWNKALPYARGEWLCFLGADDWLWDEHALDRLVPHLRAAAPRFRVVYGLTRLVDARGRVMQEAGEPWESFKARFRSHVCLPHPGLMHHRSLFAIHGRFDEGFGLAGDYEFLLRELKTGDALFVPEVAAAMKFGGRTTSPEHFLQLQNETGRALAMHQLSPPRLYWAYGTFCAWAYVKLRALVGDRAARRLADLYRLATLRKPRYSGGRN
jgi:glycosyltransferase involved in cell wall biosynthesis